MISRYFIDRPMFATFLSIAMTLTGAISLLVLPVAQYPRITPPGVSISISYPGAKRPGGCGLRRCAPIEQQVNGVERMLYMSSNSGNDGSYTLTVTFDVGTDINAALVMVQNRVALAMPQLPSAVQNQGITIRKRTPDMLMIVNFVSPDGRYDDKYLSNFATINVKDELLRVEGISDINVQGQRDYSMRVWLNPQQLAARNMTPIDVANAIRTQNVDAPAGRVGQPPAPYGQAFQYPLDTLGRLAGTDQFSRIVVKTGTQPMPLSPSGRLMEPALPAAPRQPTTTMSNNNSMQFGPPAPASSGDTSPDASPDSTDPDSPDAATDAAASSGSPMMMLPTPAPTSGASAALSTTNGPTAGGTVGSGALGGGALESGGPFPSTGLVRLDHVARLELGAQNYNTICSFDGKPSVGLGLYQLPGTNALEVADRVRDQMEELKKGFPDGVDYTIAYDTTPYIRDSVQDVIETLLEAVALVAIVVLVFLQSWRAALIPLLAVPVAVLGTFAVMAALKFSLNNISLFGLVLAIGIVVDDAIVVVENVERWMARGLSPREATYKAMEEVTGPIIAVALVLCAVFVPCAFIRGITGQFFRQFAITIAVSTVISTINSLTFSPAIAAIILRPHSARPDPLARLLHFSLGWFFDIFNWTSGIGTTVYAWITGRLMRLSLLVLVVYVGLLVLTGWTFEKAPKGFIPQQDQGRLIVNIQLPDAASLERTHEAALRIEQIARETPGVAHTVTNSGMSFLLQANSPNFASMFIVLEPFGDRHKERFQITNRTFGGLKKDETLPDDEKPPEEVLAKLTPLRNKPDLEKEPFMGELGKLLDADELKQFQKAILKHAKLDLKDTAVMARLRDRWAKEVPDAQVTVFGAAPVPGLGSAGGFKFMVEDRGGLGVLSLEQQMDSLVERFKRLAWLKLSDQSFASLRDDHVPEPILAKLEPLKNQSLYWTDFEREISKALTREEKGQFLATIQNRAEKAPYLADARTQFRSRIPQLLLEVDRTKAAALGVSLQDLNQTVGMYLGSLYVNSYNDFGRHWQVTVQADGDYRTRPEQIHLFQVRSKTGQMIPLSTLVTVRNLAGPISVTRYNLYTAAPINGNVTPGVSDGDAINAINKEADEVLPLSMRIEWTELMFMQLRAGNTAIYVFLLSVLSVFLALAALYESWTLPLAVILVVPLCLLCSVAGVLFTARDVNIFVQIGLVVLVGLACKNAILIVEFAKHLHTQGMSCFDATREASRLRLRPIVMTSFAFIFGVLPLMNATGAGAEMRRSLGVAVFSGMLGVTLFGIFLTPVFFYVVQGMSESRLFQSARLRWVLSHTTGAALGAGIGFVLARLDAAIMPWAPIVGACAGVLIIRLFKDRRPIAVAGTLFGAAGASASAVPPGRRANLPVATPPRTRHLLHQVLRAENRHRDCSLLRGSADLCDRHLAHHHAGGRRVRVHTARRALPGRDARHRTGDRDISRGERIDGARHCRSSYRGTGERCRRHDVYVVALHQRRYLRAHRHIQAGHGLGHGAGAGAKPSQPGIASDSSTRAERGH